MKKHGQKMLIMMWVFFSTLSVSAQIYVRVRPVTPVIVITTQPNSDQVWIGEDWEPYQGGYRHTGGHWSNPPHRGDQWRQGYWKEHKKHGHEWVKGAWKGRTKH